MDRTGSGGRERVRTGAEPPGRFWLLAALLFVAAFAAAALVVDRRGARILAPAPSPTDRAGSSAPGVPPSTLALEIRYDLGSVREALEDRIPRRFGELDERRTHPDDSRISYAVAAEREPLRLELRGDTVRMAAVIHYRGRVWFDSPLGGELSASCGGAGRTEAAPQAIVRLASPLEIREDWRIASSVRVEEVRPASGGERDRCEVAVGPLRMDVTDPLLAAVEARLREMTGELDELIGTLDLRAALEPHWARIQDPIRLGEAVWLRIEPESLRAESVEGLETDRSAVAARLAVIGRLRIVVGARPPAGRLPLPPLGTGPVRERFDAVLETRVDYPTASRLASEAVRGRELTVAGRVVRIDDVEVSPVGDGRLAVGLELAGALHGRVYLVGTPVLDPRTGEVSVPDLGFSVETRSVLLRTAVWLVRGGFAGRVRRALRWNVRGAVDRARALASGGIDRSLGKGVRLEGSLGGLEVLGIAAAPEGLLVRSRLDGTLRIRVDSRSGAQPTASERGLPVGG